MLTHNDLKKGAQIIVDGQPYEVLSSTHLKKAQRRVVIQTKIRNLINGNVLERNFHQGDVFKEAELSKMQVKFLYTHREKFFFSEQDNPSKRFELTEEQIGPAMKFLKPNQTLEGVLFEGKVVNISLPIKIHLKVQEAPPGIRGDRAQGGTKTAILETGTELQVPLFIQEGDIIEVNTEKEEYARRIEKQ